MSFSRSNAVPCTEYLSFDWNWKNVSPVPTNHVSDILVFEKDLVLVFIVSLKKF